MTLHNIPWQFRCSLRQINTHLADSEPVYFSCAPSFACKQSAVPMLGRSFSPKTGDRTVNP
eukprot:4217239-Pleurochrysis_carterae.AAC.1